MTKALLSTALAISFMGLAFAQDKAPDPCTQIEKACTDAGFTKTGTKKGMGLWRQCVNPIMQGQARVKGAKKPLPSVDPSIVDACKAKNAEFGMGKVGSEK